MPIIGSSLDGTGDDQAIRRIAFQDRGERLDEKFKSFVGSDSAEEQHRLVALFETQLTPGLDVGEKGDGSGLIQAQRNNADSFRRNTEVRHQLSFHFIGVNKDVVENVILNSK